MKYEIVITYDDVSKDIRFQYDPPELFTTKRDFLYTMLARTHEQLLINIIGMKHYQQPSSSAPPGTFGKGKKTDVDGL